MASSLVELFSTKVTNHYKLPISRTHLMIVSLSEQSFGGLEPDFKQSNEIKVALIPDTQSTSTNANSNHGKLQKRIDFSMARFNVT